MKATHPQLELPEPAVCYYYSGLKIAWGTSKFLYDATYAFVVTPESARLMPIQNRGQIDSVLALYKDYPYKP